MTLTARRFFYGGPIDGKSGEVLLTRTDLDRGAMESPQVVYLLRESHHPSMTGGRLRAVPPPDLALELHPYYLRQLERHGPDGEGYRCFFYVHHMLVTSWEETHRTRALTDWLTEQVLAVRPEGNGDLLAFPSPQDHQDGSS